MNSIFDKIKDVEVNGIDASPRLTNYLLWIIVQLLFIWVFRKSERKEVQMIFNNIIY